MTTQTYEFVHNGQPLYRFTIDTDDGRGENTRTFCYEGFEKITDAITHLPHHHKDRLVYRDAFMALMEAFDGNQQAAIARLDREQDRRAGIMTNMLTKQVLLDTLKRSLEMYVPADMTAQH